MLKHTTHVGMKPHRAQALSAKWSLTPGQGLASVLSNNKVKSLTGIMFCQIPLSYFILEMGWRGYSREISPSFNIRRSWKLWDTQERKHLLCFSWKLVICHMERGDRQREGRCWVQAWVAASLTFSNSRLTFSAEREPGRLRRKFAVSERYCKDRNWNIKKSNTAIAI